MEKIMCNGIEVSGCVFINMSKECRAIDNNKCEHITDCYYKQLERLNNQCEKILEQNRELQSELVPFRDAYFRGLSMATIAELAKTELRTVSSNRELIHLISDIKSTIDNIGYADESEELKVLMEKSTKMIGDEND